VLAWEYTFCPNCGHDYGWLEMETGWCKLCSIHHRAKKQGKECIVCGAGIFSVRQDAKFCGQCKGYKHQFHTALRAGKTLQEATRICQDKYKEDVYVG
jgi:ribosomal protein S27AE